MKVVMVPPDPRWSEMFATEAPMIAAALGVAENDVHHIGSTSIPNIFAKPVIDMLIECDGLESLDARTAQMAAVGYEAMGEFGIPQRRYFRKDAPDGTRTHHIHAFVRDSIGARRHLAFRDFMRAHPDVAREYSDLKRTLAQNDPTIEAYMDGKNAFVKNAEARALEWWNARQGEPASFEGIT